MSQHYTTHRISVESSMSKYDLEAVVWDRLFSYVTCEKYGIHADIFLGDWVLAWAHSDENERWNNIWVYAIEDDDDNIIEVMYAYGDKMKRTDRNGLTRMIEGTELKHGDAQTEVFDRIIRRSVRSNLSAEFVEKIIREVVLDTKKYRYVAFAYKGDTYIRRIERCKLDTTAVYSEWDLLKFA